MTQTSPPTSPGSKEDQGAGAQESGEAPPEGKVSCAVDTSDLEESLKGLMTPGPYKEELEGRKEVGLKGEEGGLGDITLRRDDIPGGWEMVWIEDPWTKRWEQVRVPREEAERRRKRGLMQKPSYWGETEAKLWRKKLSEAKEASERAARQAWHIEELKKMGCYLVPGVPRQEKETSRGVGWETKKPSHY